MRARKALCLVAFMAVSALGHPASAQSLAPSTFEDDAWRFGVTPYLFLPITTSGTSTVAGLDADIELNLVDVLELLNGALSGRAEAWRGDFGFAVEGYYVSIGGSGSVTSPGPASANLDADVKVDQVFVDLVGAYRFADGVYNEDGRRYAFDVQAGGRFNSLKQEIDANLSADLRQTVRRQRTFGGTENWWEPVIGIRGMADLNDSWTGAVLADFSGFGVNGDTLQWKVRLHASYRPWDWQQTAFGFGWEFYGIDFSTTRDDGRFAYDVFQTGPVLTFSYQFQ